MPSLNRNQQRLYTFLALPALIFIGLFLAYVSWSALNESIALARSGVQTVGRVIDLRETRIQKTTDYTLEYQYVVENRVLNHRITVSYDVYSTHQDGDIVGILYAADDPTISQMIGADNHIFEVSGLVFTLIWWGIIVWAIGFARRVWRPVN